MRTRRSVLAGVSSAFILAGCTGSNSEGTTEDSSETETPEENFEISNVALNGEPLDEYEVEIPRDASPEALASEFEHQLTYQTNGTDQPIQSTITAQYTDNTIPEEDPLNETLTDQQVEPGNVQQTVQFPDQLTEDLIENPRNIQATLTTQTQNNQTEERQFTLNYADQFAENAYQEGFDPQGSVDSRLSQTELVELEVEDGVINVEYDSEHEIGTDGFNLEIDVGIYSGIIDETRTAYELNWTVNDANGERYSQHIESDYAEDFLEGETSEQEMRNEILFNNLNT